MEYSNYFSMYVMHNEQTKVIFMFIASNIYQFLMLGTDMNIQNYFFSSHLKYIINHF